jgi:hypothetical protein
LSDRILLAIYWTTLGAGLTFKRELNRYLTPCSVDLTAHETNSRWSWISPS